MAVFTTAAIIGAVSAAGFAAATGATVFGLGVMASAAVIGGASLALSAASTMLAPKPKAQSFSAINTAPTQSIKQAITAHRIIYGEVRTGGAITYIATSGSNQYVHVIYSIAGHQLSSIGTVYFNDGAIHPDMLDGDGKVNTGTFNNRARIRKYLGTTDQTADTQLIAEVDGLDSKFRGRGIAYLYCRLEPNQDAYPNGMPNISAQLRGALLYDPRDGTTKWSPNPALVWRDYMLASYGMGARAAEIDDAFVIAAANACDEFVATKPLASEVESVNATNNWVVLDEDVTPFETGDRVRVTSTGSIPGGLAALTDYYVVVAHYTSDPAIKFATSYANALAGTTVDITSAGSGTITITKNGEPRYTCNGVVETDERPVDILTNLLTSMGGRAVYSGGKWRLYPAVWMAPTVTLDEDDLRDEVVLQTNHSMRDLFNAIQGTYISGANYGQTTNYPAVTNSTWQAQDNGERKFTQLDLPFTNRAQTCQRLAKIELERHRRQMSCDISSNFAGLLVQAGENMGLTFANNGWQAKSFEIVTWAMGIDGGGNGMAPMVSFNMSLREVDAACFEFDATTEEVTPAPAPTTNLPDAFSVQPPTNLVLVSGDEALFTNKDGTVVSRIKATWTDSPDGFADHYEFQFKRSALADWEPAVNIPLNVEQAFIWGAEDGDLYDARVRTVSQMNVRSPWLTVVNHTVQGKETPPQNVASLNAQQNGNVVNLAWPPVPDSDLAGYELRYMAAPFVWEKAVALTKVTRGTQITAGYIPPGDWIVAIKAVDTSGNYSVSAATYAILVTNENDIVFDYQEGPAWLGTRTNLRKHDVSGTLVPTSTDITSAGNGFEVFDTFVRNPVANYAYEAPEIDLLADFNGLRVYATKQLGMGPGEVGEPDAALQIDYRKSAGSYEGFEAWELGIVDARYLKFKLVGTTANGVPYLEQFTPVIDLPEFTMSGSQTVAPGGTRIDYGERFYHLPNVTVTPKGNAALIGTWDDKDTTGFTAYVFDASGNDVGGIVDWTATGI